MSIEKASFFGLTPERILAAVEQRGTRSTGRCLPLNSYENRVYEIELEDDSFVVAKFYRPGRWSAAQIQEEHDFLLDLYRAEVPVVVPLEFPDGKTLRLLEPEGLLFCLYNRRGGRIRDELSLDDLERLGRTTARIHLVGAAKEFLHRPRWSLAELRISSNAVLGGFGGIPAHIETRFFTTLEKFYLRAEQEEFSAAHFRIHGDLHMGNVLWRDDELSIVDLDDSITGPAEQDCWLFLGSWDEYREERREAFLRGYSAFGDPPKLGIERERMLAGLRQAKFLSWYAQRWDDPIFPISFAFFVEPGFWEEQVIFFEQLAQRAS